MASALKILYTAGRLRVLVSGEIDLADPATLAKATSLLEGLTPEERGQVAAKAVELGADATLVQALLGVVGGEVIEVSSRPPRKTRPWWMWLAGGTAIAATIGGVAGYRARRVRQ